jgi:hypothetical protein
MHDYRLYCLDGAGKITGAEWIEAASDDDAVRAARDMNKPVRCEVWDRTRFVARIPAFTSPGAGNPSAGAARGPSPLRR